MSHFKRHDLVWLNPDSVRYAQYAGPFPLAPVSALSLLHRWVLSEYPLIVARQENQGTGQADNLLKVGLAEPPSWGKRRLAYLVEVSGIAKHEQGPTLEQALALLPPGWQEGASHLQAFLSGQGIPAHLYGSCAIAVRTGLPCWGPASDLDLQFIPNHWDAALSLVGFLSRLEKTYPLLRVDGEVVSPTGQAVQWKELALNLVQQPGHRSACILAKSSDSLHLMSLHEYQQGFEKLFEGVA